MAAGSGQMQQQAQGLTDEYEEKLVQGYTDLVAAVQIITNGETGGGTAGNLTATLQHSLNSGPDSRWEDLQQVGQWAYNASAPDTKVIFFPQPSATPPLGFMQYVRIQVVTDASSGTWEFIAHIEAKGH